MKTTKLLYVSSLCGPILHEYLWNTSLIKPYQAIQKFHKLLSEGFAMQVDELEILSSVPVSATSHLRRWWGHSVEHSNGIEYRYLPFINMAWVKNLMVFFSSILCTMRWIVKERKHERFVICDALNFSISAGALIGAKIMGQKVVVIVTDLPSLIITGTSQKKPLLFRLYPFVASLLLSHFDRYVLLTRQMNNVVNPRKKPYLVIEGLVDTNAFQSKNTISNKPKERILLYAGGINEQFGIKLLLEAFILLKHEDIRLHIYGTGDMESQIEGYEKIDTRIKYFGVVKNEEVVNRLIEATLLINPRPTHEDFVKYSFPSKNMEYMVSGTPLLTTALPGMPEEYLKYVFICKEESIVGMYNCLKNVLSKNNQELNKFGLTAKQFVLDNKSNIIQSRKILAFCN